MQDKKYNIGMLLVVAMPIIGAVLWILSPSTVFKFDGILSVLYMLGQLFGILGFILFGISLILSARFHFLENIFYGLNKVYERHSQIGQVAFMLMLFHPLMLFISFADFSWGGAMNFFIPGENWAINWGIFALLSLIILIVLTLYLRPKYHIWKWTHKFMGLAFFLGAIHAFTIHSDVAVFMPLRYYMFFIFTFGIFSFIYHSILWLFLVKRYEYFVSGVRLLGENITEITLTPKGEKMNFIPGQFAFVSFYDQNVKRETHPFSLSSPAGADIISFTPKMLGDYTETLPKLSIGAKAMIEGPYGKFSYRDAKYKKQIWISGGIGVTPFLSMIDQVSKEEECSVDFYYCLMNEAEAVHLDYLQSFVNSKIRILTHFSDSAGFINSKIVKEKSRGLEEKEIFVCAPPPMIVSLRRQFLASGVEKNIFHSEEFNLRD